MAVDLPPPLPPQQGTVEQAQQGEAVSTVAFQSYSIHVFGPKVLSEAGIAKAVGSADTLSNAVRALASAYYSAGFPAARTTYALSGQDLYVLVTLGGISDVQGGEPVTGYFSSLAGKSPLTDRALEPKRLLASVHADRAGLNLLSELVPDGDNNHYQLKPGPDVADPTQIRVEFGNPGNRFVGRYFLDVDLRAGDRWGDEFRAIARSGMHGLTDRVTEGEYFEQNLGWNRVTPWGIFALGGRYADFTFKSEGATPFNGTVWSGEAYWLYPLFADFRSRFTVQAKVDRNSKTTQLALSGADVQREVYTSVEASGAYQRSLDWLAFRWDLEAGLAVRKGLGDPESALTVANQDYLLYRPSLRIKNYLTERFTVALELSGQITSDTVPEQQQWVLGGQGNITTSLPGVAVGDQGYLARVVGELGTYPVAFVQLAPKVFVESGSTTFKTVGSGGTPAQTDVGAELGFKVFSWLDGSVAYAQSLADKDLTAADLNSSDANLYFRVQAKF